MAETFDQKVGLLLKTLAREQRKTQDDLARVLGCSQPQMGKYLRGENKVKSSDLYLLTDNLGLTMAEFWEMFENDDRN